MCKYIYIIFLCTLHDNIVKYKTILIIWIPRFLFSPTCAITALWTCCMLSLRALANVLYFHWNHPVCSIAVANHAHCQIKKTFRMFFSPVFMSERRSGVPQCEGTLDTPSSFPFVQPNRKGWPNGNQSSLQKVWTMTMPHANKVKFLINPLTNNQAGLCPCFWETTFF